MKKNKFIQNVIPGLFILLAVSVSLVSTVHSFDFFILTNKNWMSWFLAVTFEIGQLAALGAIVSKNRLDMRIVWALMIVLTSFQIMANIYYSFAHLSSKFKVWSEMFGLIEMEILQQKRIISAISGGFLPLLSLGFTKALVDYLKFRDKDKSISVNTNQKNPLLVVEQYNSLTEWINSQDFDADDYQKGDEILIKNLNKIYIHNGEQNGDENDFDEITPIQTQTPSIIPPKDDDITIDNSKLHKIPEYIIYDKSTDKFDDMLKDPSLPGRLQNYNLNELDNLPDDQKMIVLSKTPRLLSLAYKQYQDEQKILKGRKQQP